MSSRPLKFTKTGYRGPGPAHPTNLGPVIGTIARIGARVQRRKSLGVFSTIGRAPRLFRGWLVYSATMMPFGYLSRQDTELIILRVAHIRGSEYEYDQHKDLAARVGLSPEEIASTALESHGFVGRRATLLDAAEEIVKNKQLSDLTWTRLAGVLDERQQVAFVMLVTQYDGLATALDVLNVPVDEKRSGSQ
ncbi:carboxymuconolactone decarboxylase family protein [Corynebacterium anserum]|uniref:Carboxymuconolactone decarboxylase family protein n=1 Tax=Corynebacterium anserum TaxID=2684406 RepID=A0A7G7YNU1_9CORY|nr:carboxymuconolactone decarboxylase family protein [Corynebacterium anserum]MBC2681755.1 carboxymuconolactone decarboxylase family protein [Corynebacterium anserum]QNH96161.1 carboxymuconolactone decarboxylase family protein [Corynebacterium anserum]